MALRPLMFVHPPYDYLEDEWALDKFLSGGVRDVMLGYWTIVDESQGDSAYSYPSLISEQYGGKSVTGRPVPAFHPTEELYKDIGFIPPDLPKEAEEKAERFRMSIRTAEKGINIYTFGTSDGSPQWTRDEPPSHQDSVEYIATRLQDYYLNFSIAGCVLDGPGYGYEIQPGFRGGGQAFAKLC